MPVNAPNDNLDVLAPSFNLKNIDDKMVSLDDAKGLNGGILDDDGGIYDGALPPLCH